LALAGVFARGTPIGFAVNPESFASNRLTQPGRERGMGLSLGEGHMNKLALLAAILLSLISGRSADAASLYDFSFMEATVGNSNFAISAYGTFATNDEGFIVSASGILDGSPITGFTPGSYVDFSNSGLRGWNLDLTSSAGSVMFLKSPDFNAFAYNSAGVQTFETFGLFSVIPVATTPLPASAPLFGLALLVLAALGFASKRLKPLATADGSIPY
jgi:hypothetical protein